MMSVAPTRFYVRLSRAAGAPIPDSCGHAVGVVSGVALGTVIGAYLPGLLFAVSGHDLLPTVVHKMVLFTACWLLCPCVLGCCCACAASRRQQSRMVIPAGRRLGAIPLALMTALACGLSAVALIFPGGAQDSLIIVVRLSLWPEWPAAGYCAEAPRRTLDVRRCPGSWAQAMVARTARMRIRRRRHSLVGNMTRAERHGLLNGEGYGPFGQLDGALSAARGRRRGCGCPRRICRTPRRGFARRSGRLWGR